MSAVVPCGSSRQRRVSLSPLCMHLPLIIELSCISLTHPANIIEITDPHWNPISKIAFHRKPPTTASAIMFPFFKLPADIRRICIEHVLFDSRPAPEYPSMDNRAKFDDIRYMAWRARPYHEIRDTHSPSNCLALFLTSREMKAETSAILALKGSAKYHLDLSVLNDNDVFPTWLCVPQLTTRLDKLYVDVRLFGTIIESSIGRRQGGNGGHTRYEWDFLALLERFLRYGPVGRKKNADGGDSLMMAGPRGVCPPIIDRSIKVDTLVLDFSSAEDKAQRGEFPPREIEFRDWNCYRCGFGSHRHSRRLDEYNTRPEWLAELLADEIDMLLNLGRDREFFAKLVYSRMRIIRMLVDGEVFREFNIAERLDEYKYTDKKKYAPEWLIDL
ncbi:uncharacterized protein BDV17DRAFT_179674 [Aspergillus undulatus]|uniref:uncharacterized protein n=1 Tax=Aspergillus undulatus TaxID=1810928 RepID=UPI003CCCB81C